MPPPRPRIRRGRPRILGRALTLAAAMAVLTVGGAGPAGAGSIRQAEWPLDSGHLRADQIWQLSRGRGVTVAVVDSGVDARHPDLAGQVLAGASFLGDTGDDGRTDTSSDSHGTAISGIIAATGKADGGTGMIGLAPQAKILPIRVSLDDTVQVTALAEGIKYAADHHAQVINISLGAPNPDPLLRQAVAYALGKDAVVVAAAGNDGQSGNAPQYPAAFPGVVDVTGTTDTGAFWPVSESGPRTTLAAPATGIYSTNDQRQYVNAEGTSYATAYVAAAAALIRSAHPGLTAGQTIRRLITTAHRTGHGPAHSDQFGYGSLDPLAALRAPGSVDGVPANPLLSTGPLGATTGRHGRSWVLPAAVGAGAAVVAAVGALLLARRRRGRARGSEQPGAPAPAAAPAGKRRPEPTGRKPDSPAARRKGTKSRRPAQKQRPSKTARR